MLELDNWGRVTVSLLVVSGFFYVLVLVLTTKMSGSATPEVLLVMLGALGAGFQQVISYWVGSSSGSSAKDKVIAATAEKTP